MKRVLALAAALALAACAGTPERSTAWFGLEQPRGLKDPVVKPAGAIPKAILPAGETAAPEFEGRRIRETVARTIDFATEMRRSSQMWGRIAGFPSETRTADWLAGELKQAGVADAHVQTYQATGDFWFPDSWEVRALGNPAFGAASGDVVLGSAVPVSRSAIAGGQLEAAAVFAGEAGAVSIEGVSGKIAIQHTKPTTGAYSDRAKVRDSASALIEAGAVAVINWIEQSGNMHVFDFGQCGGPCFNIGGDDGRFLTQAIAKAGSGEVRLRMKLAAQARTGLSASNVIGTIPGASDEIIIVNAHLDSWFDGAGDNADGVGVLVALARHFAKPENKPARTLVFVGSGGHHSSGMNGPASIVARNADMLKKTVLVVNLEHLAQFAIATEPWTASAAEEPKNFGVSNASPFLVATVKEAAARYGFVIRPEVGTNVPGDLGGYAPLNVARIQGIHSGPLYHTSGDVLASISDEGLTKAARFYAYVIKAAGKAEAKAINP